MTCTKLALLLVCCSLISLSKSEGGIDINANSESYFIGDKAKFICTASESDFENLQWKFENKDGTSVTPVASSEDDVIGQNDGKIYRESFLTITNASSVSCIGTLKSTETQVAFSRMITVNNVSPLSPFDDSQKCSDNEGIPKIILWRYDNTGFESRFWVPHVVTNTKLQLNDKVSHFRLICQFNSSIKWTLNQFNFRPYLLRTHCAEEILEVNPISAASSRDYICSAVSPNDAKVSSVSLIFPSSLPTPSLVKRIYDNETMDAIESIVETFDSSKAVGLGFGSSFGSIALMIGILFLKKTLQRRRAAQNESPEA